jgi:hypothetical protein
VTPARSSPDETSPASQRDGVGWGLVVFAITQFAQIGTGGLVLLVAALALHQERGVRLESFGAAFFLYLVIASKTGYPLFALVLSACYRHAWAPLAHLGLTLAVFAAFGIGMVAQGYQMMEPILAALGLAPLAGYFTFRAMSPRTATPPPAP